MIKKYLYILAIAVLIGFSGCEALDDLDKIPDPKIETSVTYPINGEYYVTLDMLDGTEWVEDVYGLGYKKIMFSNTATNDADVVWFDDLKTWPTRAKVKCNPASKTFIAGTYNANFAEQILAPADTNKFHAAHEIEYKAVNVDKDAVKDSILVSGYGITVTVSGGTVELGTFEAPSKTKADAINIELEWSDDPGTKYRYKGYRRTGFLEDEH